MNKFFEIQGHLFSIEGLRGVYTKTEEERKIFSKDVSTKFNLFLEYSNGKRHHWEFSSRKEVIQTRDAVISQIQKLVEQV